MTWMSVVCMVVGFMLGVTSTGVDTVPAHPQGVEVIGQEDIKGSLQSGDTLDQYWADELGTYEDPMQVMADLILSMQYLEAVRTSWVNGLSDSASEVLDIGEWPTGASVASEPCEVGTRWRIRFSKWIEMELYEDTGDQLLGGRVVLYSSTSPEFPLVALRSSWGDTSALETPSVTVTAIWD